MILKNYKNKVPKSSLYGPCSNSTACISNLVCNQTSNMCTCSNTTSHYFSSSLGSCGKLLLFSPFKFKFLKYYLKTIVDKKTYLTACANSYECVSDYCFGGRCLCTSTTAWSHALHRCGELWE